MQVVTVINEYNERYDRFLKPNVNVGNLIFKDKDEKFSTNEYCFRYKDKYKKGETYEIVFINHYLFGKYLSTSFGCLEK